MPTIIHLQASDGEIFQVDLEDVKCSGTIMSILEQKKGTEMDEEAVYLEKVNRNALRKVVEWMKHHKGDPTSAQEEIGFGAGIPAVVDEWDRAYLEKQESGDLFELILAAHDLNIKGLLDITATKFEQMIGEKSMQQLREAFELKKDFTQKEIERILNDIGLV